MNDSDNDSDRPASADKTIEWTSKDGGTHRVEVHGDEFWYSRHDAADANWEVRVGHPGASLAGLPAEAMPIIGALAHYITDLSDSYTERMRQRIVDEERAAIIELVRQADWMSQHGRDRLADLIKERDRDI
jgi:hypothetical protein